MKQRQCKCGGTEFTASQKCYHDIRVNGDNTFIKEIEISQADSPYGPYTCTQCGAEYDELSMLAEVEVEVNIRENTCTADTAAEANTVFEPFEVKKAPRKAIHLRWDTLHDLFTRFLIALLGREVEIDIVREEFYFWKVDLHNPITKEEQDNLFRLLQVSDKDRAENDFCEHPIMELSEGLCNKLAAKLLSLDLSLTRADDGGVWFIGEMIQSTLELALPNGMSLKAQAVKDPDYPCIQVTLKQPGCSEDIICFAEFNSSKPIGKEICISAYAHNLDEPVYYASYHDDGTPCGVV